jgi:hypothetical protein
MDLPAKVSLTRCDTGAAEVANIETLSRETAKNHIDLQWWNNLGSTLADPQDEPDSHWEWREIVSKVQSKRFFASKCVRTEDQAVQAAILFQVDAKSVLETGEKAIFVDRLATAPRNRGKLVQRPVFRGAGTGLLSYAIAQSYSLGFGGRVNLFAIANEEFYTQMGLLPTSISKDEMQLFELPASTAFRILKEKGLIDD